MEFKMVVSNCKFANNADTKVWPSFRATVRRLHATGHRVVRRQDHPGHGSL